METHPHQRKLASQIRYESCKDRWAGETSLEEVFYGAFVMTKWAEDLGRVLHGGPEVMGRDGVFACHVTPNNVVYEGEVGFNTCT